MGSLSAKLLQFLVNAFESFTRTVIMVWRMVCMWFAYIFQITLLAHLSRRLTGELIVYTGIRRPSVVRRPSVRRPSTFSNDISSEVVRRILSILHI